MKLKEFNQISFPKLRGKSKTPVPKLTLTRKGVFCFNGAAVKLMSLDLGSKLSLCQDEEEPDNWYFYLSDNGFTTSKANYKDGIAIHHRNMAKKFLEYFRLSSSASHCFLIAGKPTIIENSNAKYWGIIIKSAL